MTAFQRFLDPTEVSVTTVRATLSDPLLKPEGMTRFGRYPLRPIRFVVAEPSTSTNFSVRWPVTGSIRLVDLLPAYAAALGVSELIELSPLPFTLSATLRALGPGLPTFYFGFTGAPSPAQDDVVRTSDPSLTVNHAVIGCMFQDRNDIEPWAWIDLIGNALELTEPAEAADWRQLANLFQGQRSVQVRDASGLPVANEPFRVRFLNSAGHVIRTADLTSNAAGDLGQVALPQVGERAEITWNPTPLTNDETLPVLTVYEDSLLDPTDDSKRTFPGETPLVLPDGFTGGHLQVTDLARWYAPVVVSPNSPSPEIQWPARFRPNSHVEPLVDGLQTYTKLVEDIRRASGIHLAGWKFDEFPMRPHDPDSSLVKLMDSIGRDKFRLLLTKSFQPKIGALDGVGVESLAALYLLLLAAEPLIAFDLAGAYTNGGLLVWNALALLIVAVEIAANPDASVEDFLREKAEFTDRWVRELLYDVSDGKPHCAFPAPHPVLLGDNPISHDFSIPLAGNLSEIQDRWGVYPSEIASDGNSFRHRFNLRRLFGWHRHKLKPDRHSRPSCSKTSKARFRLAPGHVAISRRPCTHHWSGCLRRRRHFSRAIRAGTECPTHGRGPGPALSTTCNSTASRVLTTRGNARYHRTALSPNRPNFVSSGAGFDRFAVVAQWGRANSRDVRTCN